MHQKAPKDATKNTSGTVIKLLSFELTEKFTHKVSTSFPGSFHYLSKMSLGTRLTKVIGELVSQ